MEAGAGMKLHAKGRGFMGEIQGDAKGSDIKEGAKRDIKGRQGEVKVEDVRGAATTDAIKKAGIRGPISKGKIQHGFIKGNMMSFLHRLCFKIIIKNIPHRFGKTKEETGNAIRN